MKETLPPQWPLKVLRLLIRDKYLEEIEGDMEEIFYDNLERMSVKKARRLYTIEMIKLLRPSLLKHFRFISQSNPASMITSYFKVSFRGLAKNPVNAFINVFGLAVAIGLFLFAYAFARWTYRTDQFHEHKNSVYLTTFFANRDGVSQEYGTSPRPLGEFLRQDFPQIKNITRVEDQDVVMKYNDNVFHERVRYVDQEFLDMFTFPLKWGSADGLKDIDGIVLSEDMSIKYFGEENPIDRNIEMIYGKGQSKIFRIVGVADEFPKSRTFAFNFLVNFENLKTTQPDYNPHDWESFVDATFVQVDNPAELTLIKDKMSKYKDLQNKAANEDWAITAFSFEPLATLHERSEFIKDDISRSSKDNFVTVYFMMAIATFMLALACINYINIAIATAAKRLKEIGVRKTIGATRWVVITQFLTENVLLTMIAMITGVALGYFFLIPGFESLWSFSMDFRFKDPVLWTFLPVLLILTSLASGIYPAVYISRFQVTTIIRGRVRFGQRSWLTKTFLCCQLIFACAFIGMSVMFTQNTDYMAQRSWGYDPTRSVYAAVADQSSYERLSAAVSQHPDVIAVAGSTQHVGRSHQSTVMHFPQRNYEVEQLSVGPTYFETLGLELKEGRGFHNLDGSDKHSVVVNEMLATSLGGNAVGQIFHIDTVQYQIVGVLKEFHSYPFTQTIHPTIFTVADKSDYRFLMMRVAEGKDVEVYKSVQENWAELFPDTPFDGGLQQEVWGFYYEEIKIYKLVWRIFAFLSVALATLGLYGLVRLNVEGRTKEFSVRKVLGAELSNISSSVTRPFLPLFAISLAAGAPLGYFLGSWLIEYADEYHMTINMSGAFISLMVTALVLVITVSTQVLRAMKTNTVNGLKVE